MNDAAGFQLQAIDETESQPVKTVGVWDLSIRLFHWGLVACVITAWLTGGTGESLHETVGYVVAGLVVYRILWGFVGTRHARFKNFVRSPFAIIRYIAATLLNRAPRHIGHNPAGGAMIIVLILVMIVLSVTGAMMQSDTFFGVMWVEIVHEVIANTLLFLIPMHIFGVVVASWAHKENLLGAMVTGCKRVATTTSNLSHVSLAQARDFQILQRIRGTEGLLALAIAIGIGGFYGWSTTLGRKVVVESQPPWEGPPTMLERSLSQSIQNEARKGARQDYVAGGPEVTTRTWLISSGGRLYDNWFKALGKKPPKGKHVAWPSSNTAIKAADTWRCKSCHGWDYRGKAGQYASGPNATGIGGIRRKRGRSVPEIIAILSNKTHAFSNDLLPPHAKYRLALFVSEGQHTVSRYITAQGKVRGRSSRGRPIFQNICAACHGFDGKARRLGKSSNPAYKGPPSFVGTKARANPTEVLHKIRNGHPGAIMISMRPFPMAYSSRLLAYVNTLPRE